MPIDYPLDNPKSEKDWRAEEDARTLARAEAIKADNTRLSNARVAAEKMLESEREDVRLLSKVSGRRTAGGNNSRQRENGSFNVFQKLSK